VPFGAEKENELELTDVVTPREVTVQDVPVGKPVSTNVTPNSGGGVAVRANVIATRAEEPFTTIAPAEGWAMYPEGALIVKPQVPLASKNRAAGVVPLSVTDWSPSTVALQGMEGESPVSAKATGKPKEKLASSPISESFGSISMVGLVLFVTIKDGSVLRAVKFVLGGGVTFQPNHRLNNHPGLGVAVRFTGSLRLVHGEAGLTVPPYSGEEWTISRV